jgi:uncharacterized LabA/DUF88 family protein
LDALDRCPARIGKYQRECNQCNAAIRQAEKRKRLKEQSVRSYLFIDGEYLRRNYTECVRPWFGSDGEIDFAQVKAVFEAERAFFYDALDDREREGESTQDYDARVASQRVGFNRIQELNGYFVRLGSLGGRDKKQQKKVDILLAVEALDHAVRRNMDRAILLSGDRDFEPLVHSLVQLGIRVEVAGDKKNTSPFLRHAADTYRRLSFDTYLNWSSAQLQTRFPVSIRKINMPPDRARVIETGLLSGKEITFRTCDSPAVYYVFAKDYHRQGHHLCMEYNEQERLKLYLKLQYGEVEWNPSGAV